MKYTLKSCHDLQKMTTAGRLAAEVLEMIGEHVRPGVSTGKLDSICHRHIVEKQRAIPAALNYKGFPKSVCISVNEVVCHGIPDDEKILRNGDIVNIDVAVIKDGWFGDTSKMYAVGRIAPHARKLIDHTQHCLYSAIALIKPGIRLGDIGHHIDQLARKEHYSVVREFCGHGIGRNFHEQPQVLHYGIANTGMEIREGMTFTVEPMLNLGSARVVVSKTDGWTVSTRDRRLSAQWEHTLAVTASGCRVLTARAEESFARPDSL